MLLLLLNEHRSVIAAVWQMRLSPAHEKAVFVAALASTIQLCQVVNPANLLLVEGDRLQHLAAIVVL